MVDSKNTDKEIEAAIAHALDAIVKITQVILASARPSRFSDILRIAQVGILLQREARQTAADLDRADEEIVLEGFVHGDGVADIVMGNPGLQLVGPRGRGVLQQNMGAIVPDQHQLYRELMAMVRPLIDRVENQNKVDDERKQLLEVEELAAISKLLAELPETDPLHAKLRKRRDAAYAVMMKRYLDVEPDPNAITLPVVPADLSRRREVGGGGAERYDRKDVRADADGGARGEAPPPEGAQTLGAVGTVARG